MIIIRAALRMADSRSLSSYRDRIVGGWFRNDFPFDSPDRIGLSSFI